MSTGKLIGMMALFVLLGFPMVWYLWETLNEVLAGEIHGTRLLVAVPVFLVFLGLLTLVARSVQRWDRAGPE